MSKSVALAIAAHPDDIEFMMGGTMILLKKAGYETHYLNVANGSMGTAVDSREVIVAKRTAESRDAAHAMGAVYHEPFVDDLDILFDRTLCRQVCAVVREVKPTIVLTQSPQDYMEDHMNACRLAVAAAFYRGMLNYKTDPPKPIISTEVAVYHGLPYGLCDQLRRVIKAGQYVDITSVLAQKREALACHKSQKEWLDTSQGLDSYLITMEEMSAQVGAMSGAFQYAEGWRRHSHLGFCGEQYDPLTEALGDKVIVDTEYERNLKGGF